MAGVAVQHEDADALYLQQALRLPGLAPVAVAGNGVHGEIGEALVKRLSVPQTVAQMEDMPGLGQLHGAGHIVHIAVGI